MEYIEDFCNLDNPDELLNNLLLGNGFSMMFSNRYDYQSLLDQCDNLLYEDRELFKKLGTSNFETCLNKIMDTITVNNLYGIKDNHIKNYERIRNSLIETIRKVHIEREEIDFVDEYLATSLFRKARNIFTTNYDLLSYWTMLSVNEHVDNSEDKYGDSFFYDYKDYRKVSDLYFSESFSQNTGKKIYYLHGALHLYEDDGVVKKLSKVTKKLLEELETNLTLGFLPLFVSEGNWVLKKKAIESNSYLRFCYDRLRQTKGSLTIFGHSLNEEMDKHIAEAINESKIEKVIYGIYDKGKTPNEVKFEQARIKKIFENKEVVFYKSSTIFDFCCEWAFGRPRES
jgi:hypothetical protein